MVLGCCCCAATFAALVVFSFSRNFLTKSRGIVMSLAFEMLYSLTYDCTTLTKPCAPFVNLAMRDAVCDALPKTRHGAPLQS